MLCQTQGYITVREYQLKKSYAPAAGGYQFQYSDFWSIDTVL